MKLYLLSVYQPDGDPPPPEVLEPIMREVHALQDDLKAAGAWVFSAGLHDASTATVVRVRTARSSPPTAPTSRARSTSVVSP